jgi:hypothetical protein
MVDVNTADYLNRPEILDCDMRTADVIEILERLKFERTSLRTVKMDSAVRDFLVAALRRRI